MQIRPRSFGTHNGTFHADEVTACALLILFDCIDRDKIIRTRDGGDLSACDFVCDVGGVYDPSIRRFDHHQVQYQGLLSSAGMVWQYLLDQEIITQSLYDFFNTSLILGVDSHDNGRAILESGTCTFSQIISNFTPTVYDSDEALQSAAFFKALAFTTGHLERLLERYHYNEKCRKWVKESMKTQGDYLLFDAPLPWMDVFFEMGGESHPARFVIMPSGTHWKLRSIPPSIQERMKVRLPLPALWAGLMDKDLQTVTGIPGAIFCHKGCFISVWKTKEDALLALKYTLEKGAV